ncbi:MAG: hypothetical protein BroJett021_52140 [Chloroflexota bacterium]|jgi:hypothetical protein|nr:MAG: hypothetical protein BroJett021_52140 [Chloroflexota bacterium]
MNTFAICVSNAGHSASLELHKLYRVLPDVDAANDGDLRIVDESGENYLCPAANFVLVEAPSPMEQGEDVSVRRKQIAEDAQKTLALFRSGKLLARPVEDVIASLEAALLEPDED